MQSTFLNFYNVGLKNYLEFTIRKRNFLQKMYRENNWKKRSQKKKYVYIFKFWHFYCKNTYIEDTYRIHYEKKKFGHYTNKNKIFN